MATHALESRHCLDQTEFRRLVRHGLGRAVLHLQQNDSAPYIDIILDACRTNDVYDRQVNGDRTDYLMDLVTSASAEKMALDHLITEFSSTQEVPHWVLDLVARFAATGHSDACPFLYAALERDPTNWCAIEAIIEIDGLPGLDRISNSLSRFRQDDRDARDAAWHALWCAESTFGREAVAVSYVDCAGFENRTGIRSLHRRVEMYRRQPNERVFASEEEGRRRVRLKDPSVIPFRDVWSCVERQVTTDYMSSTAIYTPYGHATYREWGTQANDTEIAHAAWELAAQPPTNIARIARYAQIFAQRPYPLDPQPLIDAVVANIDDGGRDYWTSAEGWAVHCCLWALGQCLDPALTPMALELRSRTDHWRGYWTLLFPHDADPPTRSPYVRAGTRCAAPRPGKRPVRPPAPP